MSSEKPRQPGGSRTHAHDELSGFAAEVVPLLRDGLVVIRTLLDVAIARLDEIEEGRVAHVRRETYEAIVEVLEAEIARLRTQEPTDATEAQLDALRSIQAVLDRKLREAAASSTSGDTNGEPSSTRNSAASKKARGAQKSKSGGKSRRVEID